MDEWQSKYSVKSLVNVTPYYCLSTQDEWFPCSFIQHCDFFFCKHLKTQLGLYFSGIGSEANNTDKNVYLHKESAWMCDETNWKVSAPWTVPHDVIQRPIYAHNH